MTLTTGDGHAPGCQRQSVEERKGNRMDEVRIKELEALGFNRWQKGSMDRLYINAAQLGLNCEYYKTGNVRSAEFNGEQISNSEARRMKDARTYIDVKTGKIYGDSEKLKEAAAKLAGIEEG